MGKSRNSDPSPPTSLPTIERTLTAPDSKPPPPAYGQSSDQASRQPNTFACLILSKTDRLRALAFPDEIRQPVDEAIRRTWPLGVTGCWTLGGGMGVEALR